jgi:hypothetical protein
VDREILLKMAEAWEALVRRSQKKLHWTERTSY